MYMKLIKYLHRKLTLQMQQMCNKLSGIFLHDNDLIFSELIVLVQ